MIPMPAQNLLITAALDHSSHEVRRVGLGLVAERDGLDAARARAIKDPNARIRAWAESGLDTEPAASSDGRPNSSGPRKSVASKSVDQPTLF